MCVEPRFFSHCTCHTTTSTPTKPHILRHVPKESEVVGPNVVVFILFYFILVAPWPREIHHRLQYHLHEIFFVRLCSPLPLFHVGFTNVAKFRVRVSLERDRRGLGPGRQKSWRSWRLKQRHGGNIHTFWYKIGVQQHIGLIAWFRWFFITENQLHD